MINVPEDLIHSIPPNDHLLYASSDSPEGEEIPLAFILSGGEQNKRLMHGLSTSAHNR